MVLQQAHWSSVIKKALHSKNFLLIWLWSMPLKLRHTHMFTSCNVNGVICHVYCMNSLVLFPISTRHPCSGCFSGSINTMSHPSLSRQISRKNEYCARSGLCERQWINTASSEKYFMVYNCYMRLLTIQHPWKWDPWYSSWTWPNWACSLNHRGVIYFWLEY